MVDYKQIDREIAMKMCHSSFEAGSSHLVEVTHINNPASFYVRLSSLRVFVEPLEVKGPPISKQSACPSRVIYKSPILQKYVRGVTTRNPNSTYNIVAIDYGCYDMNVPPEDLFHQVSPVNCQAMAIYCKLDHCEPVGPTFDEAAINAMKNFIGTNIATMTVKDRTHVQLLVEMNTENAYNLSTMLEMMNLTVFTKTATPANRLLATKYYRYRNFTVGDKLTVRVQYGESMLNFYVADLREYDYYQMAKMEFNQYCWNQQRENVNAAAADGRGCAVNMTDTDDFERAIVVHVTLPGRKALVKLIDWGNNMEVRFDQIRTVDSEYFFRNPAVAIFCATNSAKQPWKTNFPKFLYQGYQFKIEVLQEGDGLNIPHKVKLIKTY